MLIQAHSSNDKSACNALAFGFCCGGCAVAQLKQGQEPNSPSPHPPHPQPSPT